MQRVLKKFVFFLLLTLTVVSGEAHAAKKNKPAGKPFVPVYAAMVLDHRSGKVLHQTNIDQITHPASLTKVMTLYMLFDALKKRKISLNTRIPISKHAANQKPGKLYLKPGTSIAVRDAIPALVVKSANDVAAAVAEFFGGGSEEAFGIQMTQKARQLGLKNTVFKNASGLPNKHQVTTARDMIILFKALYRDFPDYYRYFKHKSFTYNGQKHPAHTKILGRRPEIDGYKTGFVNASGFNIVISAKRDNTRLFACVMGGQNSKWRDKRLENLLDHYFPIALKLNSHLPSKTPEPSYPEIAEIESRDAPPPTQPQTPSAAPAPNHMQSIASTNLPKPALEAPIAESESEESEEERDASPSEDDGNAPSFLPSQNDSELLANIIAHDSFEHLEATAQTPPERTVPALAPSQRPPKKAPQDPKPKGIKEPKNWTVQLGTYTKKAAAQQHLKRVRVLVPKIPGDPSLVKSGKKKKPQYAARLNHLSKSEADNVCQKMRFHKLPCLALKN